MRKEVRREEPRNPRTPRTLVSRKRRKVDEDHRYTNAIGERTRRGNRSPGRKVRKVRRRNPPY